jgi:hypothetical protein
MTTIAKQRERKPRQPKVKAEDLAPHDIDNHLDIVFDKPKPRVRASGSKNEVIKSRLSLIIDMLDMEDGDEKTYMRNRPMCVKHLREIMTML